MKVLKKSYVKGNRVSERQIKYLKIWHAFTLSVKVFLKDDALSISKVSVMPNIKRQGTVQGRENLVTAQL